MAEVALLRVRIPYWVAEWEHRYSMNPMLASIEQWPRPLSPVQWAKTSSELLAQISKIEKAFVQGQSFMDYFNSTLGEPVSSQAQRG